MTTSATTQEPTPQEVPGGDRVREHTDADRLRQLDGELRERVAHYVGQPPEAISARIRTLECESDMERLLAANASTLALVGVAAGAFIPRRFLLVPMVVLSFLLQHAIQGWCPPLPLFRRFGVRSRQEIDAERYALKALRGTSPHSPAQSEQMIERFGTPPARGGAVFGFGLGGLADGVVLHQILQWHHLVSDDTSTKTVEGLEHNTLADGLFHAAIIAVLLVGVVLLWNAAKRPSPSFNRVAAGGILTGFGAFHIVDEIVFHALLDLHHIRMVDNYLAYDLAFAAIGVVLIGLGICVLRPATSST